MNTRPLPALLGVVTVLAAVITPLVLGRRPEPLPQQDSLAVVVRWPVRNDGRGDPDSFAVSLSIKQSPGTAAPQTLQHTVRSPADSFRVAAPAPGQALDLSVTVQGFRGYQTSRPIAAAWRFPSNAGRAPGIDPADSTRLILDMPPLGFGGQVAGAAQRPRQRPLPPAPSPGTPPVDQPSTPLPSTTPPGTGAGCANEPPGFRLISRETWEKVPPAGQERKEPGWFAAAMRNRFSIIEDPTVPQPNKRVIQGLFPTGHPGGRGPFKLVQRFQGNVRSLYMCMWHKISDNFTNNGNTGTKFGFLLTPYDEGNQRVHSYLNLSNRLGINLSSAHGILNRNMQSRFDIIRHRGEWHRIEWLVVANSRGQADGVGRIWVDGDLMLSESNARYFLPDQEPKFIGITWNPTYGGGTKPVPYDMFEWIGEWYISGQ